MKKTSLILFDNEKKYHYQLPLFKSLMTGHTNYYFIKIIK